LLSVQGGHMLFGSWMADFHLSRVKSSLVTSMSYSRHWLRMMRWVVPCCWSLLLGDEGSNKNNETRFMASSVLSLFSMWGHYVTRSLIIKPYDLQNWLIVEKDWERFEERTLMCSLCAAHGFSFLLSGTW
jgi:hypothetical protein